MKKKLTLEKIIQGRDSALGIKEIFSGLSLQEEITDLQIKQYDRIRNSSAGRYAPHIAIIDSRVVSQLRQIETGMIRRKLKQFFAKDAFLMFCSGTNVVPEFLKNYANNYNIAVAASALDEYCLESRLTALLSEKFQNKICFHGVVLEMWGRGIMITGVSGIGKTTAALHTVREGHYWVADDVALVRKNPKEELIAGGHDRIKNLIYTKKTGIVPVNRLIDARRIKKETKLAVVIEVEKNDIPKSIVSKRGKEILETSLPCLHIRIPLGSYFNKNLLKKSLRPFFKDN